VRLRPAGIAEIEALQRIDKAARARYGSLPGFEFVVQAPAIPAERFDGGETILAEAESGAPLGFALLQPLDGLLYLANISVLPERRGHGIGPALLDHAARRAEALGTGAVTLTTFRLLAWNGPWFRRFGFTAMPDQRIGPGLRAIMDRQAVSLDPSTRETLWRPVSVVG